MPIQIIHFFGPKKLLATRRTISFQQSNVQLTLNNLINLNQFLSSSFGVIWPWRLILRNCSGFLHLLSLPRLPLAPSAEQELGRAERNSWQRCSMCLLYHILFLNIWANCTSQLPLQSVWLLKVTFRASQSLYLAHHPKVSAANSLETTCTRWYSNKAPKPHPSLYKHRKSFHCVKLMWFSVNWWLRHNQFYYDWYQQ